MSRKIFVKVFISLLIVMGVVLVDCAPTGYPNLKPNNTGACILDDEGMLVFYVGSHGTATAPASVTRIECICEVNSWVEYVNTPELAPSKVFEKRLAPPEGCLPEYDLSCEIIVDYNDDVPNELDEDDNTLICNIVR